jgi:glycosyltransferase involved in cell wall biosynthesis
VVPNLPPKIKTEYSPLTKISNELKLISIARISPEKNTLFALNILHQFAEKNIAQNIIITFDLFGTVYDERYWTECKVVIATLPINIKVNFKGAIEKEKISETLTKCHFLFLPSQGENYGHSIVESFIAGRPVIISDQTPWKNLSSMRDEQKTLNGATIRPACVGWDLPLDKSEEFVKVLEYCIKMEQMEYDQLSINAYNYGQIILNNQKIIDDHKELFR